MALLLVRGVPGVGKTTLIKAVLEVMPTESARARVCRDTLRQSMLLDASYSREECAMMDDVVLAAVDRLLHENMFVAVDGTCLTSATTVERFRDIARNAGCQSIVVEATCKESEALIRLENDRATGAHPAKDRDAGLYYEVLRRMAKLEPDLRVDLSGDITDAVQYVATACRGALEEKRFRVTVRTLAGTSFEIVGLTRETTLSELHELAAAQIGVAPYEFNLVSASQPLAPLEGKLHDLGVDAGAELSIIRRTPLCLLNPGKSRFNANYCCTVFRVLEVGWSMLQIDFEVVGDMSLGRLQNPRESTLAWQDDVGTRWVRKPDKSNYERENLDACVKGSLTYVAVPTTGEVRFTFGSAGYFPLVLNLNPGAA